MRGVMTALLMLVALVLAASPVQAKPKSYDLPELLQALSAATGYVFTIETIALNPEGSTGVLCAVGLSARKNPEDPPGAALEDVGND